MLMLLGVVSVARDARARRLCEPTTAGPRRAVRREWPAASVEAAPFHGVLNQPLPGRGFLLRALWREVTLDFPHIYRG